MCGRLLDIGNIAMAGCAIYSIVRQSLRKSDKTKIDTTNSDITVFMPTNYATADSPINRSSTGN